MAQLFKNNAFSALAASLTNSATTLTVTTSHGDRFPIVAAPDFFLLTLQDSSNNIEIVRVTERTAGADSMTILRGQDGTAARAWNIGDIVELRLTAFALNPLGLFAGASTAAQIRAILDLPTRSGGDASGTWSISITGNAATATLATNASAVTNGVYTTGDQTIAGVKRFSNSMAVGGSAAPATSFDIQTTGANVLTSTLTTGLSDLNFRLGFMNGVAGSSGASQAKFGLFYLGVGESATIDFIRGGGATDGTIAFRSGGTERARIDSSGNVGIGTASPASKLHVAGTFFTTSTVQVPFIGSATGTSLVIDASGFIKASSSSRRYKENIEPIDAGLAEVLQMQPVKYDLKATGEAQVGFIAEDFPEQRLVNYSLVDPLDPEKGKQVESVNYSNLTAILVKAAQELKAINDAQAQTIESLTARVVALESMGQPSP